MFERKIIIVTGNANGIGKEIYDRIPREEFKVIGIDKENDNKKNKINLDISTGDYSVLSKFKGKKIYGIINNAAILIKKPLDEYTNDDWLGIVNTNIKPIWELSKLFKSELIENKGFIINISSVHSVSTLENVSLYAMSKGAVESLSRALSIELGKYGVRVNCIRPGAILTRMLDYTDKINNNIPIGRVAKPSDIYDVVHFLIYNPYIIGECITVDGGSLAKLSTGI